MREAEKEKNDQYKVTRKFDGTAAAEAIVVRLIKAHSVSP